jgi:Tol biopolymer transport system component
MTMNGDGTSKVQTYGARKPSDKRMPDWSPTGDRIVFSGVGNDYSEIYSVSASGTNLTNLTNSAGVADLRPAWRR